MKDYLLFENLIEIEFIKSIPQTNTLHAILFNAAKDGRDLYIPMPRNHGRTRIKEFFKIFNEHRIEGPR